jgi:hypothetical protein
MATSKFSITIDNTSDATFAAWASAVEDAILAMGWTVHAETGATDPHSSPARPTAGSYLFRVYQPADALQTGSTTFYLRFDYGSQTAQTNPSYKFSLGTGTNGSGTLTGNVIAATTFPSAATAGSTSPFIGFASGDTDRLALWLPAVSAHGCLLVIERLKDSTGANTSDGVTMMFYRESAGLNFAQTIHFTAGLAPSLSMSTAATAAPPALGSPNAGDSFNDELPLSPWYPVYGHFGNPLISVGCVNINGYGKLVFLATIYGTVRTYMALSASGSGTTWVPGTLSGGNNRFYMIWE